MARLNSTVKYENVMQDNIKQRFSIVDIFSIEGRIGRHAYFIYSILLPFAFFGALISITGLISRLGNVASAVSYAILTVATILMLFVVVRLTIQRCHDFNAHDRLALFALIPFANIIFALIPGDNGLNSFGEEPKPATGIIKASVKLLIVILLAVAIFILFKSLGINLGIFN